MPRTYKHIKNNYISNREKERSKFLKIVKSKYGNKYNYDKMDYINNKIPITIHCNIHNIDYQQVPYNHISNNGCPKCYTEENSSNTEKFIERAKHIHGDKYDYSKTIYTRADKPVEIICPTHGIFTNIAQNHLAGAGCHKCSNQIHVHRQKVDDDVLLNRFIAKAKKLYGNRFDYSKVNVRGHKPLFFCNIHKVEFRQERRNHLRYFGCKQCAAEKHSLSQDEFIKRSKAIYGEQFDYSLVKYKNSYTKVKIICKEHGPIDVIPYDHMRGKAGCPKCSASSYEQKAYKILEDYKIPYIREYKIDGFDYRYDILLPDVNVLIELHGDQHYNGVHFFNLSTDQQEERDKDKATIAKACGYKLYSINCIKSSNHLLTTLKQILRSNLKYFKNGKYFKSFIDLSKYFNLPNDINSKECEKYKTRF